LAPLGAGQGEGGRGTGGGVLDPGDARARADRERVGQGDAGRAAGAAVVDGDREADRVAGVHRARVGRLGDRQGGGAADDRGGRGVAAVVGAGDRGRVVVGR